jgi:MFS transporter, PPP family, 3-phenylpropionic acid transporter
MKRNRHEVISPHVAAKPAFASRLAIFYAALFMALGVQLPFLPVWLAASGLHATTIGAVLAAPLIVRVFAVPLATRAADRHDALRGAIVVASAAAVLGYIGVGLVQGTLAIAIAFALACAFSTPIMPLADAYAVRGLDRLGRAYGPVRLWGSAAFIAGSFGAGLLLEVMAARHLIWLMTGTMLLTALAACTLTPLEHSRAAAPAPISARLLLRDGAFLVVAVSAGLIQASHAIYYGFSALEWQAAGLGGEAIGALWALGVIAEIVLFAFSPRIPAAPETLLLAGASGAVVRWSAMALDPPQLLLPLLQCLHALSFGATHLGAVAFVARAAPVEMGATAQGTLAVVLGLLSAAAMGLAGWLYARWGGLAYGAMALAAAAGGALAFCAQGMARPK